MIFIKPKTTVIYYFVHRIVFSSSQVGNYFKPARASRLMAQAQETQRASSKSISCFAVIKPSVTKVTKDDPVLEHSHLLAANII